MNANSRYWQCLFVVISFSISWPIALNHLPWSFWGNIEGSERLISHHLKSNLGSLAWTAIVSVNTDRNLSHIIYLFPFLPFSTSYLSSASLSPHSLFHTPILCFLPSPPFVFKLMQQIVIVSIYTQCYVFTHAQVLHNMANPRLQHGTSGPDSNHPILQSKEYKPSTFPRRSKKKPQQQLSPMMPRKQVLREDGTSPQTVDVMKGMCCI